MPEVNEHDGGDSVELRRRVAAATERAKFKNWRLRRLKERNEAYLASRRDLGELDELDEIDPEEITKEL